MMQSFDAVTMEAVDCDVLFGTAEVRIISTIFTILFVVGNTSLGVCSSCFLLHVLCRLYLLVCFQGGSVRPCYHLQLLNSGFFGVLHSS